MRLSSDPRFEAYVERLMLTAENRLPPGGSNVRSRLPFLLVGVAAFAATFRFLNSGDVVWSISDALGLMGLVVLASLCRRWK